jgi:hypothetical protein
MLGIDYYLPLSMEAEFYFLLVVFMRHSYSSGPLFNSRSRAHLANAARRILERVACDGFLPKWTSRIFRRVSSLRTMPIMALLILARVSSRMIMLHFTIIDGVDALFK